MNAANNYGFEADVLNVIRRDNVLGLFQQTNR